MEDHPRDAQIVRDLLERAGLECDISCVEREKDFEQALAGRAFDVILLDFKLPEYDGFAALKLARERQPSASVLLLSGVLDDDQAMKGLEMGATDYLLKDRLGRLPSAVRRAVAEAAERRQRRRVERELTASERQLRAIFDAEPECVKLLSADGRLLEMNPAGLRMLEADSFNQVALQCVYPLVVERHRADFTRLVAKAFRGEPGILEFEIVGLKGGRRWLETHSTFLRDESGRVVAMLGITRDITLRRESAEVVRRSQEHLAALINSVEGIVWEAEASSFRFTFVSPRAERLLGYPTARWIEEPGFWASHIHPEDRERAIRFCQDQTREGRDHEFEYRMLAADGRVVWLRDIVAVVSEEGKPVRLRGIMVDITEQRALELQLRRSQRVEAIGALATGIAHDLNNIFAPIVMGAGLLADRLTDARDRELMKVVEASADRGRNVVRQLLTFTRGIAGERVAVQLTRVLAEMVLIVRETFPRNIRIDLEIAPDLGTVIGDSTQLHQVLMNLCVNARDAMPMGGRMVLGARNVQLTEADAREHPQARAGSYASISVGDTGEGIEPELIERIFDPFFTTKTKGQGTGLGLATVQGIVRSHGGFVAVESRVGEGSRFTVYLPLSAGVADPAPARKDSPPRGESELILVADDERAIRETTRRILEDNGYRVVTADDGAEALKTYMLHSSDVRLVLTDLMMPTMDGATLIRALRSMDPALKVIATSGVIDQEKHAELKGAGVDSLLMKPCEGRDLLEAIAGQLRGG